jgi:hypothetical protein
MGPARAGQSSTRCLGMIGADRDRCLRDQATTGGLGGGSSTGSSGSSAGGTLSR